MTLNRWKAVLGAVAAALLLGLVGMTGSLGTASAQQPAEGEVTIYFVAFACPNMHSELYTDCEILSGAEYSVEADGVELGPFTTGPTSLVPGFTFNAPVDATLTVTQIGGVPAGYVPLSEFDPLVVNVADLPEVGCGGESTCPGIEFVNLITSTPDDSDDGSEVGGDVSLPETGTGTAVHPATTGSLSLLGGLAIILGLGAVTLRRGVLR